MPSECNKLTRESFDKKTNSSMGRCSSRREEGGRAVCILTTPLNVLIFHGLEERYYQNDLLAMISLPSSSFQAGTFLQGRKKGHLLRSLWNASGGTQRPSTPNVLCFAGGSWWVISGEKQNSA